MTGVRNEGGTAEAGGTGAMRMRRTVSGRLRGWGGVAAMATSCALAVTAALLLPLGGADGADPAAAYRAPLTHARYADAQDSCEQPERSLDPALGSWDGDTVKAIQARGRLKVGVDQNSYLWGFRDPATGQLAGFDIDIVKAIAKDILGDSSKVQYLTVPTDQRIPMIQQDKVDMVVRTMTINCARIKDVAFSTAYFEAGQQLLVPDGSSVTGYDKSLKGKTVCTAKGSTGEARLTVADDGAAQSDAERFGTKVMLVANQLDCLVRLQLGLADAVFTDNALAAGQAAQDPSVKLVGKPVTTEPYGVAMKLPDASGKGADLVRRVNKVLAAYESGGSDSPWMASYHKWLATDLPGLTGPPAPLYQ